MSAQQSAGFCIFIAVVSTKTAVIEVQRKLRIGPLVLEAVFSPVRFLGHSLFLFGEGSIQGWGALHQYRKVSTNILREKGVSIAWISVHV
jgi:hypothetical protein